MRAVSIERKVTMTRAEAEAIRSAAVKAGLREGVSPPHEAVWFCFDAYDYMNGHCAYVAGRREDLGRLLDWAGAFILCHGADAGSDFAGGVAALREALR